MDHQRFDALARRWATRKSRRAMLKGLTSGAASVIFIRGELGEAAAKPCKRAGKHCKAESQCCDGLVCEAGWCRDDGAHETCKHDADCPPAFQLICGLTMEFVPVENRCRGGFCTFASGPPPDHCCECANGGACIVADGSCCAVEQVCKDRGKYFCCPGTDYCGIDQKGKQACLSANRACTSDDTSNCSPEETCAKGVCCPTERACPDECCGFGCVCNAIGHCDCNAQAGVRRF